ncbi:MAG: hypothetical protein ACLFTW_15585 [Chitinispirillaceae bacterium]
MPELFRDIDDLGFGPSKKVPKGPGKFITGCPERDEPDQEEKPEPLVRLLSARWKPGPRGFQYNEQCFLEVRAQYLKKTVRSRVRGKLYGIYNGIEEDLGQEVEGFIQKDGTALLDIKHLWFVDEHYRAWKKDKTTPVKYQIKEISHSRGENVIDGPVLEMPVAVPTGDRWLIFESTSELIDPDFSYEMSGAEPAKSKWIYVFGSPDGLNYSRVWEIRTNETGKKFTTVEINRDSYDSALQKGYPEDVVLIPGRDENGATLTLQACFSDIRLTKERIFESRHGLLKDPSRRCFNIDDSQQALKLLLSHGEEKIVISDTLLYAETLRKRFEHEYHEWEDVRLASWFEENDQKRKEKLVCEFGALVLRIVESVPEYKKHLRPGQYPILVEQIKGHEDKKSKITKTTVYHLRNLCRYLLDNKFTETCNDYISLICPGTDQPSELYCFEDRVGNLFENITRFGQGHDTLKQLLPSVRSQKEHTWLQELLMLKNDVWGLGTSDPQEGSPAAASGSKQFQNLRKLGDGLTKLLIEGAKSGINDFKPGEMAKIIERVFKTTGQPIGLSAAKVAMVNESVRPFKNVVGNFDEKSFWRFEINKNSPYRNMFTKGLTGSALKNFLAGLEGIAFLYSLQEHLDESSAGKVGSTDHINISIKLVTYFAKNGMLRVPVKGNFVKLGGGPVALLSMVTSALDTWIAYKQGEKYQSDFDYDAAVWNKIAAAGNLTAFIGYTTTAVTFYAGAAALSSTGIGIAPGLLLAFVGTTAAIGSNVMAAKAVNTPLERELLRTPWGLNPVSDSSIELKNQYVKMIRTINCFDVEIDTDTTLVTIHLKRLEPETKITIHEVIFGIPMSADGSTSAQEVVGTNISLSSSNCTVLNKPENKGVTVQCNLLEMCKNAAFFLARSQTHAIIGQKARPDYIGVKVSADLDGDGFFALPDENHVIHAEKYTAGKLKAQVKANV